MSKSPVWGKLHNTLFIFFFVKYNTEPSLVKPLKKNINNKSKNIYIKLTNLCNYIFGTSRSSSLRELVGNEGKRTVHGISEKVWNKPGKRIKRCYLLLYSLFQPLMGESKNSHEQTQKLILFFHNSWMSTSYDKNLKNV